MLVAKSVCWTAAYLPQQVRRLAVDQSAVWSSTSPPPGSSTHFALCVAQFRYPTRNQLDTVASVMLQRFRTPCKVHSPTILKQPKTSQNTKLIDRWKDVLDIPHCTSIVRMCSDHFERFVHKLQWNESATHIVMTLAHNAGTYNTFPRLLMANLLMPSVGQHRTASIPKLPNPNRMPFA